MATSRSHVRWLCGPARVFIDPRRRPGGSILRARTDFHADRIAGLTIREDQPVFGKAEVLVPETEWAWWTDGGNAARTPEMQRGTFAVVRRRFGPYQPRLRRIADGAEVAPGFRAVAAYGHTPGHTAFHVADGDQQLFIWSAPHFDRTPGATLRA
ncbi:MAG: hypothetical protein ICV73_20080 [Acetobacteraceae bacterium]|nr:hypothetical protein [Acetobacteraceae bacterium]